MTVIDDRARAGQEQPGVQRPFVSVVIPVLDCAGEVESCVRALRAQDYPADHFEILIVDNGSTDGTPERVRAMGLRPLHRAERGRSRALNEGLRHARGEIICSTDISCRPERGWLSAVVATFDNPAVGCVAGEIKLLETRDSAIIRFQRDIEYMSPMGAQKRTRPPFLPYADGANASFRKAVFDAVGPFEECFIKAADVEICYRMLFLTDYQLAFCRSAVVWEPGEESLAKLLTQRYRIGIGNVLLEARFPRLFQRASETGGWRRRYWRLREGSSAFGHLLGALARAPFSRTARSLVYATTMRGLMAAAQRAGRIHARRDRWRSMPRPEAVESKRINSYRNGDFDVRERVVAL